MIKKFYNLIIFVALFGLFPILARAGFLQSPYHLSSAFSVAGPNNTGEYDITGQVTGTPGGPPLDTAHIHFTFQKFIDGDLTGPIIVSPSISPSADGTLTQIFPGLECSEFYAVTMFEDPSTLIQVNVNGVTSSGFQTEMINCNNVVPNGGAADLVSPPAAGSTIIHAVNWGQPNVNDHAIYINNAYIVPFNTTGDKMFQVVYGSSEPNQYNQPVSSDGYLGYSNTFTLSGNTSYNFAFNMQNLLPNTSYYFDINEYNPQTQTWTALLTYDFVRTAILDNASVHHNFQNNNADLRVYGSLKNSLGTAFTNTPITIDIHTSSPGAAYDPSSSIVDSFDTTTGGSGLFGGGAGYFEHVFPGLTSGSTYYISIISADNNEMINQIQFTMPAPGDVNPGNDSNNNDLNASSTATGLIPCGSNGQPPCDFDQFIVLINRVVNFLILLVAFPVIAIMVAWSGILLLTSGGSSEAKSQAKRMLGNVVKGLVIALLAWSIIKVILVTLGYHGPLFQIFNIT